MVRWLAALKAVGSPFHDSTLAESRSFRVVGVVGVAGWNTKSFSGRKRVEFGTLLGPEETP
jgi:hypothetical protein